MRKIVYISGSRADYGPARQVLRAIKAEPAMTLDIIVTGMHLDSTHGETWQEIAADGFVIKERINSRVEGDTLADMAASVGLQLHGLSLAINRIQPDIILVLGDRGEQLAGAMAGAFQNKVVAHLCGGSVSGSIDNSIRHAITKFAHYHFPAFESHANRIIQMGEDPSTVKVVGLPGGDIREDVTLSPTEVRADLDIDDNVPYLLVVQHSVTHSRHKSRIEILETLEAVASLPYPVFLANPNDDSGGREILSAMKEYATLYQHLHILPPQKSRNAFASTMAHAGVLIGNSSTAVLEAASVGLPVVNIGDRQIGREHPARWQNVSYDRHQIRNAIETCISDTSYRREITEVVRYFDFIDTSKLVVECMQTLDLEIALQPKKFNEISVYSN